MKFDATVLAEWKKWHALGLGDGKFWNSLSSFAQWELPSDHPVHRRLGYVLPFPENILYEVGFQGYAFPTLAVGYRFGAPPPSGRSRNYAEDRRELGVSMAWLEGEDPQATWLGMWQADRPVYRCEGLLLESHGSDGEPLMIVLESEKLQQKKRCKKA